MSAASTARCRSRSHAWLRALVLLLALLVPGAHAQAHALPALTGAPGASGASGSGEVAEHDVLDTVLRPPARADRRNAVRPARLSPGPPPKPARGVRACPPRPAPPRPPYLSHILRTVVLRC
ncbi:hypothetical protein ABIE67_004595 [Streptomyces sp. V4I8]|uniref:hypothetical protein n=1 Tax=Streptomyces sp. V4I8 TaxID=3156469 RepID=UPI0035184DC5